MDRIEYTSPVGPTRVRLIKGTWNQENVFRLDGICHNDIEHNQWPAAIEVRYKDKCMTYIPIEYKGLLI